MKCAAFVAVIGCLLLPAPATARLSRAAKVLRERVYHAHHCLAEIIDREDPSWDPTISYRGGHDVYSSYGLGQALPGTKMAPYGRAWRTNPWTQLRWMHAYSVQRYGSECRAWAAWQRKGWW